MSRLPTTPGRRQANTRQLTPGSGNGRSSVVAATPKPKPATVRQVTNEKAVFSVIGDMEVRTSGIYEVEVGGLLEVKTKVTGTGTSDTEFDILLNGSPAGAGVVLPDTEGSGQVDILAARAVPGDELQLDITQAGMHPDMVVQVTMKG